MEDIIAGIVEASKITNEEIMIGNEKSYSIIQVAKLFKRKIKFIREQKGERFKSPKIINSLSFKPKKDLKEYIKTFEHNTNNLV